MAAVLTPCNQMSGLVCADTETYTQLLDMMLNLQQMVGDYFVTARQQQVQSPEEANHTQVQEDVINHTLCQMITLLWAEATAFRRLQEPPLCLDSRGGRQRSPSSRQPDQPVQPSGFKASFVSHVLSNRGVDISVFYQTHFQDYDAYQGDKYQEEKNPLVRMGGSSGSPSPWDSLSPVPNTVCHLALRATQWPRRPLSRDDEAACPRELESWDLGSCTHRLSLNPSS